MSPSQKLRWRMKTASLLSVGSGDSVASTLPRTARSCCCGPATPGALVVVAVVAALAAALFVGRGGIGSNSSPIEISRLRIFFVSIT